MTPEAPLMRRLLLILALVASPAFGADGRAFDVSAAPHLMIRLPGPDTLGYKTLILSGPANSTLSIAPDGTIYLNDVATEDADEIVRALKAWAQWVEWSARRQRNSWGTR